MEKTGLNSEVVLILGGVNSDIYCSSWEPFVLRGFVSNPVS